MVCGGSHVGYNLGVSQGVGESTALALLQSLPMPTSKKGGAEAKTAKTSSKAKNQAQGGGPLKKIKLEFSGPRTCDLCQKSSKDHVGCNMHWQERT